MGRSVSTPHGAHTAYRVLDYDDCDAEWGYDMLCEHIRDEACAAFPSFTHHEGWRGREDCILLRNAFADVGLSIYGHIAAIWLVEREDGAYQDRDARTASAGRTAHWLRQVAPRFTALFAEIDCVGRMSNGENVYLRRQAV